jgi:hypothetical protein
MLGVGVLVGVGVIEVVNDGVRVGVSVFVGVGVGVGHTEQLDMYKTCDSLIFTHVPLGKSEVDANVFEITVL